jgi:Putative Flp pilus-assembly TadE/G-like
MKKVDTMNRRNHNSQRCKKRAGYILITGSVISIGLFAFMGLAVDTGYMEWTKRKMQSAADAAAMAAMFELSAKSGNQVSAGQHDAGLNGFTDGTHNITVTINVPPTSGTYAGNNSAAEAIISQPVSTYFMGIMGFRTITVKARSVAALGSGPDCVIALEPSKSKALVASGSASIQTNCGVVVDSNSSDAMDTSGSACISGTSISIVGDYNNGSSCGPSPAPQTGQQSTPDPLAYVAAPTVGGCDYTGWHNAATTLNPGVYCGGINLSGGGSATFNAGTYILLGGGLDISGGSNGTGTGVTFYNTCDSTHSYKPIVVSGASYTSFSAPTSGSLSGMLFFQDRTSSCVSTSSQNTVSGGSATVFQGALYFPTTPLVYSGGSYATHAAYTIIVADTINFSGSSYLNNDYSSLSGGSPIKGNGVLAE